MVTSNGDRPNYLHDRLAATPGIHISQVVNVGRPLKARLELAAREEGRDAESLARFLIRQHLNEES